MQVLGKGRGKMMKVAQMLVVCQARGSKEQTRLSQVRGNGSRPAEEMRKLANMVD